jgi:hypothetical protein
LPDTQSNQLLLAAEAGFLRLAKWVTTSSGSKKVPSETPAGVSRIFYFCFSAGCVMSPPIWLARESVKIAIALERTTRKSPLWGEALGHSHSDASQLFAGKETTTPNG